MVMTLQQTQTTPARAGDDSSALEVLSGPVANSATQPLSVNAVLSSDIPGTLQAREGNLAELRWLLNTTKFGLVGAYAQEFMDNFQDSQSGRATSQELRAGPSLIGSACLGEFAIQITKNVSNSSSGDRRADLTRFISAVEQGISAAPIEQLGAFGEWLNACNITSNHRASIIKAVLSAELSTYELS